MCNRYVDGLATWAPDDPDFYRQRAALVAETATPRRRSSHDDEQVNRRVTRLRVIVMAMTHTRLAAWLLYSSSDSYRSPRRNGRSGAGPLATE